MRRPQVRRRVSRMPRPEPPGLGPPRLGSAARLRPGGADHGGRDGWAPVPSSQLPARREIPRQPHLVRKDLNRRGGTP